jgi:exopolysaccharide biosynthesis WecB/TagA/CpsF family protein
VEGDAGFAELMDRLGQPDQPMVLAFVNAHAMNTVASSSAFFELLACADTLLRDGSGMATFFKMLGAAPGLNLNGTDLIPKLLTRFNGRSVAFFGTSEPHLTRGVAAALRMMPASTWVQADGFRDTASYEALAELHRPALIVLGMGMPRQEEVAAALRARLTHPCLIVCGGAIIDFLGGKTPRAPRLVRSAGMEWMWRLAQEPRRLFQRYVIGNPLFIARAWRVARRTRR